MVDVYSFLVPIVALFAPALVLVVLGLGKWGFLVGMTAGVGLGYVFTVPPMVSVDLGYFPSWLVFAVVLVDVVLVIGAFKGMF